MGFKLLILYMLSNNYNECPVAGLLVKVALKKTLQIVLGLHLFIQRLFKVLPALKEKTMKFRLVPKVLTVPASPQSCDCDPSIWIPGR